MEDNTYPLDEASIEHFAELDQQERILAASLATARTTVLACFLRQHKLPGSWRVAENKREIVKVENPPNANGDLSRQIASSQIPPPAKEQTS